MSRNFTVLRKASSTMSPSGSLSEVLQGDSASHAGPYAELILRLFQEPTVVALVGSGAVGYAESASGIASGLATELSASGRQVVVVPVGKLLRLDAIGIPDHADCTPGATPHVWIWPGTGNQRLEFFKSRDDNPTAVAAPAGKSYGPGTWLEALRREFHTVLLDCPNVGAIAGVVEAASLADAVVLAVEAGRTSKQQIQKNQSALKLGGARLAGCILIQPR